MTRRVSPAGLISLGFQAIDFDHTAVAVGLNSTTQEAEMLHLSVETGSARYRLDGTDPEPSTGVLLAAGDHWFERVGEPANLKLIDAASTSTVQIMAYKNAGGGR